MCDEKLVDDLAEILKRTRCPRGSTLSFSGGLDSSILAYNSPGISLITVGFEGSRDIENAKEVAEYLGMETRIVLLDEDTLLEGMRIIASNFPELSPVEISFELPLLFAARNALSDKICTGQGADELFGGYAKYLRNPGLMKDDVEKLITVTIPRERRIAGMFRKELFTPYLSGEILRIASRIPVECKIRDGVRKWILREAARKLGAPEIIVEREKKAAQYGSGIWKEMRRLARKRGMSVEELIASLREGRD